MGEKTRWCDFGGSYCDYPFPAYVDSCSHNNNKQCPWPECQMSKQPQVSERSQALADAKAAVIKIEGIPYKLGYEEKAWIERADALAAISALEVKP